MRIQNLTLLIIFTLFIGCGFLSPNKDLVQSGHEKLGIMDSIYDAVFIDLAAAHKDGRLSDVEKDKFIKLGQDFRSSFNKSKDNLICFQRGICEGDQYNISIIRTITTFKDLVTPTIPWLNASLVESYYRYLKRWENE